MNLKEQLDALLDATAFDSTGTKIGAVRQVYVDDSSGKVTFATVATGIFSADAIVPLHGARLLDNELHVDHTRDVVRDSPRPDHTEDALTPDQEVRLLEYYGIEPPSGARPTAASGTATGAGGDAAAGAADKGTSTLKDSESTKPEPKNPAPKDPKSKDKGAGGTKAASKTEGADKTPAAEKSTGAESKPTAGSSPTTRETSPIAAPKATLKDDRGEKTPTPAPATPAPTPTPTKTTTTTTTTKPTTPGGAADSPKTAKSSESGPADPSTPAADTTRDTGDSPSRD